MSAPPLEGALTHVHRSRVWLVTLLREIAEQAEALHQREATRLEELGVDGRYGSFQEMVDHVHRLEQGERSKSETMLTRKSHSAFAGCGINSFH